MAVAERLDCLDVERAVVSGDWLEARVGDLDGAIEGIAGRLDALDDQRNGPRTRTLTTF